MVRVSVAVATIVAIVYVALFSPIFKVKSAAFSKNQSCLADSKQLQGFGVFGKNIFLLDSQKLTKDLKDNFACIDTISAKKVYPSQIDLDIKSQQAVAKIEGTDIALTADGLVVKNTPNLQIPTIFLTQSQSAQTFGKITDKNTLSALNIAANLLKSDFTPQNIRVLDQGDVAVYGNYAIVAIFTQAKNTNLQLDSLQSILARSKIDAAKIAKTDLRFDKPIVIYK